MYGADMSPSVAILGAGAGGLAMGIALLRSGFDDFVIFEKSDGVGGTWRDNTYPNAACDVPSHLYSYSFEPNPSWSRTYATQPEILAYLEACADKYGLRPHLRCGTEISEARWDDDGCRWRLRSVDGDEHEADVVVSSLGMLNVPSIPEFPGLDRFRGRSYHSARWDHSDNLAGKQVAVVGTGASAVQFVPAIAPSVARLTVFQRSPCWVLPKLDHEHTADEQDRFARQRFRTRVQRWKTWWIYERADFRADADTTKQQTAMAESYIARKVNDPELRAVLTPDFPVGCKRPLISREWYPALVRDNVRLVSAPITEVTETGLRTADGEEHPVDTIIFGTGFRANEYLSSIEIFGPGGRRLHDDWADGAEAYLGTTVAGFPNLFLLYGPNTNGVNSILFIHEAQAHYIVRALKTMKRRRVASVEVRREVMDRYNRKIQGAMAGTVWVAGCTNYFQTDDGKVVTQLPFSGGRYWLRTRIFASRKYDKRRRAR
jgi:cation diffusion facilitator CzcD-associated flavoprotein CzcO